jgi:hypothetical protein
MFVGPPTTPDESPNDEEPSKPHVRNGREARRIERILRTFDFEKCDTWQQLIEHFSTGVRHKELVSVANVLSDCFEVKKLSRSARRSYPVLIKWFHDNREEIVPLLDFVSLLDKYERVIDYDRELKHRERQGTNQGRPSKYHEDE